MTFSLINELSESSIFPSRKSLEKFKPQEISELAYLHILALHILLLEEHSKDWAVNYCRRTTRASNFAKWRNDATDFYILMHALADNKEKVDDNKHDADYFRGGLLVNPTLVHKWLISAITHNQTETISKQLFVKMDVMFRIHSSEIRAVRRSVQDWPELSYSEKRQTMTRLLRLFRHYIQHSEVLNQLIKLPIADKLDLDSVEKKVGFLASLVKANKGAIKTALQRESATGGATCAANVATAVGGIGAGFCDDYTKSVYGPQKKEEKKKKVISRLAENLEQEYHEPLIRIVGRNFPDTFLHGTAKKNIRNLAAASRPDSSIKKSGQSLVDFIAPAEQNEFHAAMFLSDPRQPQQAHMFSQGKGQGMAVVRLKAGTKVLDLSDEATRAPMLGFGGHTILRFFSRPAITDALIEWQMSRIVQGYKDRNPDWKEKYSRWMDPASPDFRVSTWQDSLVPYCEAHGIGAVRFADEILVCDRNVIRDARAAQDHEKEAAASTRHWPGSRYTSLFTDKRTDAHKEAEQEFPIVEPEVKKTGKKIKESMGYDPSNPNSGHGHVFERPDGIRARCMYSRCPVCLADQKLKQSLSENAGSNTYLYHTTSAYAAAEILKNREIEPKDHESFVSMSMKPLHTGDISSRDVTLVFNKAALENQLLEVHYDVEWYHEHRAQASYIAGEGWIEQFQYEGEPDEDGFTDEDDEEEQYSNAEMNSFIDKENEEEWISAVAGNPVVFRPQDVCGVVINHQFSNADSAEWSKELIQWGYKDVSVTDRQ